ncbi:hypothetical protein EZV62_005997 [Acer yangbiense]|uniref:Disease resistance protein At4g27190-like leucine-rich repeats domain-containing protein n=1 Tax=Acer yangbiense TaxID=1000413 RepID=A0A5C7IRU4_9ROSI|nr:hypothetical protein EZV62_005997 [Acer yangbiense]
MSVLNIPEFGNQFGQACSLQTGPETPFLSRLSALVIKDCNDLKSLQGIMEHSAYLGRLVIKGCDSLTSIAEGQLPSSLKRLEISSCKNLQCLLNGSEDSNHSNASLVEYLYVSQCPALESLSSRVQLSETLQHLEIQHCKRLKTLGQLAETLKHLETKTCHKLESLSSSGQLPNSLEHLSIYDCGNLSSTGQLPASLQHLEIKNCSKLTSLSSGQLPAPLKYLKISSCQSLISIADSLQNLSNLREIDIFFCPSLDSFPADGLPNSNLTILSIQYCYKLVALPSFMHTLNSLKELNILNNINLVSLSSFPQQGFPSSLTSLSITGLQFYQVMKRLHKLTSLISLHISGCQDAMSFPEETKAIILPTCLTRLTLDNFVMLESLSPKGFRNLTSLEYLSISKCPALTSLPKEGLLSSILELHISECSQLKDYCLRNRERHKSEMANIPYVKIDGKFIH